MVLYNSVYRMQIHMQQKDSGHLNGRETVTKGIIQ